MKWLRFALPFSLMLVPAIASAATPDTFKELVLMVVEVLNRATGVLVALALVVFLYGAAYNLMKSGERGGSVLRVYLVWGVAILFVMVSIWGILNLLQQTLVGGGGGQDVSQTSGNNVGDTFFDE